MISRLSFDPGSSPRIRGELPTGKGAGRNTGIIPANTGRMATRHRRCLRWGDHPREYGENKTALWKEHTHAGSSPRIRGEFTTSTRIGFLKGIIPANTGRMQKEIGRGKYRWDHPREYGENRSGSRKNGAGAGSSPRIRGEYDRNGTDSGACGIIPANTGRISPLLWNRLMPPDHPREYGENAFCAFSASSNAGSSPRIRGE